MKVSRNGWIGCLAVLVAMTAFAPAIASGQPAKVGELEKIALATEHPYAARTTTDANTWVVYYPGATYIRLHFSRFDLAPGDWVEISNADGSEAYTFEGKGPHGSGEFWAFAILGDTAVLRLQASFGGGYGFDVDSFGRGIEPIAPPAPTQPESVCGTQDWKDVECYRSSYPTEFERAKGAVLALIGCCSSCTGFKVSDSGQFMTNNHCTSNNSGVQSTELRFQYQLPQCGAGTAGYSGAVMGSQMLTTDYTLDYTLFTTVGDSSSIPCLQIDNRLPPVGERIYIVGHPSGGVKKLSIESTSNSGGLCAVDASPYAGRDATSDVGYYCDTTNGSSGSPVLSGDTHKVVAIHHFGGCLNSGARMDRIYPQISATLDSCSGGGGGTPVCGNSVVETGEECDGASLGGKTCAGQGFVCGTLSCNADCTVNTSACSASGLPAGAACTSNGQCCSLQCKGKGKSKTCR